MAGEAGFGAPGAEAFNTFWSDFFGRMTAAGATPTQAPLEVAERMRKAFFDAFAGYAEEYMRSEAFLSMMKQSMDHALAWQQALNQHLQKGLAGAQMPSKPDMEHIVLLVRGMEDRLVDKLEELSKRIETLESNRAPRASEGASPKGRN